jgi:CTP:phosphocholine cytidylyltransferase-like protein
MPVGGLGERFTRARFSTPKPLIVVDGAPMFKRARASLDAPEADIRRLW